MLINGQHIKFSITFSAPPLSDIYKSFTVTDNLIDGLSFIDTDSVVKINGSIVAGYYFLYDENNNIKCFINNIENTTDNLIEVILDTIIIDKSKIINNNFSNTAFMYVNDDEYLENTSNECSVQLKMPSQNELIISPESQHISSVFSYEADLFCDFKFFGIPVQSAATYVVQTQLIDGYTFDENSTLVSVRNIEESIETFALNNFVPKVTYEYNDVTKMLTTTIINSNEISNKLVNINLAMKPETVPKYNEVNNLVIELFYNMPRSKIIDIKTSSIILREPINLVKSCDKFEKKLDTNTMIYYTLSFTAPKDDNNLDYICFIITDTLHECLAFDLTHSTVLCENVDIQSSIIFPEDKSTGTIDIMFRNYDELYGKNISIRIACYIRDVSLTPKDNILYNDAVITPNSNMQLRSASNKIAIRLRKYDEIKPRNDIISSVASIERSNSFILAGEADIIRRSKGISIKGNEINSIRNSVKRIINTSSMLEHIMYQCLDDTEY